MTLEKILAGAFFSIPVGFFLSIGFSDGVELGDLIIWGVVLVLGIPWNFAVLISAYLLWLGLVSLVDVLPFINSGGINGFSSFFWIVIFSAIVGVHINGVLFIKKVVGTERK